MSRKQNSFSLKRLLRKRLFCPPLALAHWPAHSRPAHHPQRPRPHRLYSTARFFNQGGRGGFAYKRSRRERLTLFGPFFSSALRRCPTVAKQLALSSMGFACGKCYGSKQARRQAKRYGFRWQAFLAKWAGKQLLQMWAIPSIRLSLCGGF